MSKRNFLVFLAVLALAHLDIRLSAAHAGEVSIENSDMCTVRLTGVIEPGDTDKVAQGLASATGQKMHEASVRNTVVCLRSPGGSYDEGVKLATYFIDHAVQTAVEADASCISACAVAFMGGSENHYESVHMASRNLHIAGKLGFHAPFVELPPGQYSEKTIQKSYAAAFSALARLAGMKPRHQSTEPIIDANLIAAMAANGPDEAFFIDTVGKASRFGIELIGGSKPSQTQLGHLCNVCENIFGVKRNGRDSAEACRSSASDPNLRRGNFLFFGGFGSGGEIDGVCAVQLRRELTEQYASGPGVCYEIMYDRMNNDPPQWNTSNCVFGNFSWSYFYSPSLTISRLPRGKEKIALTTPWASGPMNETSSTSATTWTPPETIAVNTRMWNHNGSTMRLVAEGGVRRFYYENPRQGVRSEGVSTGTLLFEGTRSGNIYSGTAYIFTSRCGKRAYSVSGSVSNNDRLVTMVGQAPRLNSACQVVGYQSDNLIFEYLGQ